MKLKSRMFSIGLLAITAACALGSVPATAGPANPVCEGALIRSGYTTLINRPNPDCICKPAA